MTSDDRRTWNERLATTQALSSKALQKEREGDLANAYSLCIQTAQSYLWLIRNTNDEHAKQTLKAASTRILGRAEKIKAVKRDVRPAKTSCLDERKRKLHKSLQALTPLSAVEQEAVLDASSSISGQRYVRWSADSASDLGETVTYSDPSGHFSLAEEQKLRLNRFARLPELSSLPVILGKRALARDVTQNCVTDCSVISALMACLHHHNRFSSKLAVASLYPQDSDGWPEYNPSGRYSARLHCNGISRKFKHHASPKAYTTEPPVIDDYLPIDKDNALLCASMEPSNNYWASMMEKAYIKLHGGYSILGSVPSIDIHAFTGWIPEQILLRDSSFRAEQTWRQIAKGYNSGSCLVCLGTGKHDLILPGGVELAAKHAFAILDIQERPNGSRFVVIADPWSNQSPAMALSQLSLERDGQVGRLHEVAWHFVCEQFHAIYCNWNPESFEHRVVVHTHCQSDQSILLDVQMGPSPSLQPDEVWVLLSRHITGRQTEDFLGLHVHEQSTSTSSSRAAGLPSANFSDSTQILFKYRPERPQATLSVAINMHGVSEDLRFSLSAFSDCPMKLSDVSAALPYALKLSGRWTGKNAGGNPSLPTFIYNPHYRFDVPSGGSTSIQAVLGTERRLPVNLILVKDNGNTVNKRIQQYETVHMIANSGKGAYSYGVAHLAANNMPMGTYTLIPSTFRAGETADFRIALHSTHMLDPRPVPQEDAGRFTKSLKGSWTQATAGGSPRGARYRDNPRYRLRCDNASSVSVLIQVTPWSDIPVNVSIFTTDGTARGLGQEIASSGAYAAYVSGCATPEVRLRPASQEYLVVPSTFSAGVQASFTLILTSDQPVVVEIG